MYSFETVVERARVDERNAYLRRTLTWTMAGLGISAATGVFSALVLAMVPVLMTGYLPMILILGCWAITNFVAQPMVFGGNKTLGFVLGTATQGVAMGFLLLVAAIVGKMSVGNPLIFIGLAGGLTFFAALGMAAYCSMAPRDFSMIGAGLAALSIPLLIVMAISFVFPAMLGGTVGLVLSGLFVAISVGSLLYQLNQVMHRFTTSMHIEGAYTLTIGILVLFWNILSLLMRLNRR